jgi:thymidylate kinase
MDLDFHEKIRNGYINLYKNAKDVVTIDASASSEIMLSQVVREIFND